MFDMICNQPYVGRIDMLTNAICKENIGNIEVEIWFL